ncbi:MAG: RNA polymerase subunit sigma-70 [Marmoricola sp.]
MSNLLVSAALAGDERAFEELVVPHRRELHVHCYRMLGSFEDAEDAVQETLVRAWTRIGTYAEVSSFRAWLYAIATNACLDALRRRKSRTWPTAVAAAANPADVVQAPSDLPWLQPYPDALLAEAIAPSAEESVVQRESIELAFLAALQHLPPRQRAVLILRDVLNWSAKEVADVLGASPAAINSALQRAHATLEEQAPDRDLRPRLSSSEERAVLEEFVHAWEAADVERLAGLLAENARFVMPPRPTWFAGRDDVVAFLSEDMNECEGARLGANWRLVPTRANQQSAFGLYVRRGDSFVPFAVGVLAIAPAGIEAIDLFMEDPSLFGLFDLPATA